MEILFKSVYHPTTDEEIDFCVILRNCESLEDVMLLQRFGFDSDSKTYRQPFLQTNFCLNFKLSLGPLDAL